MTSQMSAPNLPLDLLITVAEFLAGSHAFGTLAALNQVNHDIQSGTTPVLYETLFLDKVDEMRVLGDHEKGDGSQGPLAGFRYTKSVQSDVREVRI
jgi:hypothetical protein